MTISKTKKVIPIFVVLVLLILTLMFSYWRYAWNTRYVWNNASKNKDMSRNVIQSIHLTRGPEPHVRVVDNNANIFFSGSALADAYNKMLHEILKMEKKEHKFIIFENSSHGIGNKLRGLGAALLIALKERRIILLGDKMTWFTEYYTDGLSNWLVKRSHMFNISLDTNFIKSMKKHEIPFDNWQNFVLTKKNEKKWYCSWGSIPHDFYTLGIWDGCFGVGREMDWHRTTFLHPVSPCDANKCGFGIDGLFRDLYFITCWQIANLAMVKTTDRFNMQVEKLKHSLRWDSYAAWFGLQIRSCVDCGHYTPEKKIYNSIKCVKEQILQIYTKRTKKTKIAVYCATDNAAWISKVQRELQDIEVQVFSAQPTKQKFVQTANPNNFESSLIPMLDFHMLGETTTITVPHFTTFSNFAAARTRRTLFRSNVAENRMNTYCQKVFTDSFVNETPKVSKNCSTLSGAFSKINANANKSLTANVVSENNQFATSSSSKANNNIRKSTSTIESNCRNMSDIEVISSERFEDNVGVEYHGRMANNMIQYLHARLHAMKRGTGLVLASPTGDQIATATTLRSFHQVTYSRASAYNVNAKFLCGGKYAQQYSYLLRHRAIAKCLFSPMHMNWTPKQNILLTSSDVVIHLRDPMADNNNKSKKGYSLDTDYFMALLSKIKYSRVFIVAQSNLYTHPTLLRLKSIYDAVIYQDDPVGDWSLLVMAPTLIGSFGTFTWMAAYLSEGHSIHLPYLSNHERGSLWHPGHSLFIHDDPRIVYHDVLVPHQPTFETASQVLARNTTFAKSVRARPNTCVEL